MVNDKIYELAKQAGLIEFDSIPGSKAVTPSYESIVKARKFAELMVRECATYFDNEFEKYKDIPPRQYTDVSPELNEAERNSYNGWLLAMDYAGVSLLEHFGVKE